MIDHRPGDLVCTASADVGLADLNRELARTGQMLALDPPGANALTLAQIFDGNLAGPLAHRYGEPRDLVLGMRVRLNDGTRVRFGGSVVKNVAGLDLSRVLTGAGGALGVIEEVTVRLHPLPEATCTLITGDVDGTAIDRLAPACVEYAWPPGQTLVRFASPVADALARRAQAIAGGDLVEDDGPLWAGHRERAAGLHRHRCLPADCAETIQRLRSAGAAVVVGRLLAGDLRSDVPAPEPAPPGRLERQVLEAYA
ncbi:MAG TPA: FAD-binding protein [Gaiellales bacterium]|nr:FAD-binding protein [Gaiellales bacterium]